MYLFYGNIWRWMINLDLTHPSSWLIWSGLLSDVSKYFQTQNKSNSKLTLESNSYHACGLFRDGQEIHRGDFSLLTPTGKLLSIFCSKKANSNFYRWIKFRGIHWAMSKRILIAQGSISNVTCGCWSGTGTDNDDKIENVTTCPETRGTHVSAEQWWSTLIHVMVDSKNKKREWTDAANVTRNCTDSLRWNFLLKLSINDFFTV